MTRTYLLTLLVWLATYNGWAQGLPAQVASGNVVLPSADISVADTLDAPFKLGFAMHGPAPGWGHRLNSSLRGNCSLLYWKGVDDGRPMFRYTGSMGLLSGFCLSGKYHESERTPEKLTLFALHSGPAGMGTGKLDLSNCTFAYADCGIEIGKDLHDKNCDNLTGTNLRFHTCKTAIRVKNHMGMHQSLGKLECRNCETFATYESGGDLKVSSLFVVGGTTVLRIGTPGPGENNGIFEINDVKSDQQSGSGFRLLDIAPPIPGEHPSRGRVTFGGGLIAYDGYASDGATLATICGAWKVTIRDYENLQGGMFKLTAVEHKGIQFRPVLVVENCTLENGVGETPLDLIHPDSVGYTFIARNCCDSRGNRLPDVEVQR